MPATLASRLNFTTQRNRPVKQRVEPRDPHTAHGRFDVFEKRRKAPDNSFLLQILRDATKFFERYAGFICARNPWRSLDFLRRELPFQGKQNIPFLFGEL